MQENNQSAIDTIKKWLNRGRYALHEIETLAESKKAAIARATKITGSYNERVVGVKGNRHDAALIAAAELGVDIDIRIAELNGILCEISHAIYSVDDGLLRILLINRYVLLKTWEQIAVDMNYGWAQVHRLHSKAIRKITIPKDDTL